MRLSDLEACRGHRLCPGKAETDSIIQGRTAAKGSLSGSSSEALAQGLRHTTADKATLPPRGRRGSKAVAWPELQLPQYGVLS